MVIVIVGPTAVGKTKLSIELSKKLNGEVINGDSTQVYKGLDIATAKVTEHEKENIPHHLIDIKDITEDYTVFDFQKDCRNKIEEIINRGHVPIIVGGTGLYIKAALFDYKFEEDNNLNLYENLSNEELFNKLISIDPDTLIHKNNRKRVVRAINYYEKTGIPFSNKEKTNKLLYDAVFIGLTTDRNTLYERINERTDKMINQGLLEEAKKIYDINIRTKAITTPIGYKELFDYFDNKKSLEECIELIKQKCRNYAKRQYTWFNNQMNIKWFNVNFNDFNETINEIYGYIKRC
ncbi:MAG: tRNA (adenosine(37)-N6)-dimethylallyltransferase MiaA [Clostridium sp.]|nr:tRNA (adenosine(37)-N6)-dimethylallyltransferase MiaA [Clostridium sp.]MCM1444044.1 tRNA (adenosine(37)-N6)-dimethylallyltransferase MiaA [Candidatus Amulumruptor caecigallinarius]